MSIRLQGRDAARPHKALLSIRLRLMLLAVLALVPLLFDRIGLVETRRAERVEIAAAKALDLARRTAESQRQIVSTARAVLQVAASGYANVPASHNNGCGRFLARLVEDLPSIKGISIAAPNGRIACSTTPGVNGLDLSDRPYFRKVLQQREFVLSDYLIGRRQSQPTVIAAAPVMAGGEVGAVVLASVKLEWLGQLPQAINVGAGAGLLLIDGQGTVVVARPGLEEWIGKRPLAQPLVRAMLGGEEGTITTTGLDGIRRIFAVVGIPWTNARLAVGVDEAAILAQADAGLEAAYLQFATITLLALIMAWFAGDQLIVRPIRTMARKIAMFGRGDLDLRLAPDARVAEFVPLIDAFNGMASRLAAREHELRLNNDRLAELASLDALSGVANRRSFDARLAVEWERARSRGTPLSLLMIDVDRFKLFNDTYGHVEGDTCLRRIGAILAAAAREPHFAARYGGEEFAVLLHDTDCERGGRFAERLRRTVEDLAIAHAGAPRGRLTLSIGVACVVPAAGGPAALVEAADAALYAAKRGGRNRVNVAAREMVRLARAS